MHPMAALFSLYAGSEACAEYQKRSRQQRSIQSLLYPIHLYLLSLKELRVGCLRMLNSGDRLPRKMDYRLPQSVLPKLSRSATHNEVSDLLNRVVACFLRLYAVGPRFSPPIYKCVKHGRIGSCKDAELTIRPFV